MPRPEADRNLLFGIIALQMDFIGRDALIAAMNAWVLEKHRPIGEILVEQGRLDPKARAMLDPMVDLHVANHDNDPAASLAAITSIESVAEEIRREVADADVHATLAYIPATEDLPPRDARAFEAVAPAPAAVRYRKVRDHARGGLGVVYVALDGELKREVALKEIKPEYADNLASQSRFLLEAEITGGLEHPGIVPVYGLGHYDDGRPFYAMRFIRGDSLKDAIIAFHADPAFQQDPGARMLELQKLLRRFLDVCNAVAYAHNRGVLHRDLKPDNVMVGRFGETLVVDWGLAKAVGRKEEDGLGSLPESTILQPSSGSAETRPGSRIGTPGYMSPEQAAGRLDLLGPASDVYSLGATLYALLTGRVPFADKDLAELFGKVERGEFDRPRKHAPWLDPALEAICLRAMALGPSDRYASPRALADEIERWLAGEPVLAYPEPWARKARRWAGKHRTGLATAASALLVAALLLGTVAWVESARRQRTDASALARLAEADTLAVEARTGGDVARWDRAITETLRAQERLDSGDGSPALRRVVASRLASHRAEQDRLRDALESRARNRRAVDALDEARLQGANMKGTYLDSEARLDAYLAAFRSLGIDLATLPAEEAARRVRSSPIADDLIAALDDWVRYRSINVPKSRLNEIIRASETDPVRVAIREAVARRDPSALRRLCERADDRRNLGPRLRLVFNSLLTLDPGGSFPLLEAMVLENPADFWLNHDLGQAYKHAKPPRYPDAVRYLSAAVALRPASPSALINLGLALNDYGRADDAVAAYRQAIRIQPDLAITYYNLGIVLKSQGKVDEAVAAYREAIRFDPAKSDAFDNLGLALRVLGRVDEAIAAHREAIRLKPDFANAYNNLGVALAERGKSDEAVEAFRTAIRLKPDDPQGHYNLGLALGERGDLDGSIAANGETIRLKPDFAQAYCNLGMALRQKGRFEESLKSLERGHMLGSRRPGWPFPSETWVAEARRLVELEAKLPALLKGEATPADTSERLALRDFCYQTGRHATAAKFAAEAFRESPATADDLASGVRYNAACSASLAASGQGRDEPTPDEPARVKLSEMALNWLRAELKAWEKQLAVLKEPAQRQSVAGTLTHWKQDTDLAGIRDEEALAKLPDGEREAFRALWADVEALRKKALGVGGR